MNIRTAGVFPETLDPVHNHPSHKSLEALFSLRRDTYEGFAKIEASKGILKPEMSLSTTLGQEAVRVLIQRGLEEMIEAYESNNRDHYLEELIDAINYLWVLAILDPKSPIDSIIDHMAHSLVDYDHNLKHRLTILDLGGVTHSFSPLSEKLRNRSWMNNAQSPYFDGWQEISDILSNHLCVVYDQFIDWKEFVSFFIAKDRVLQFRLASKY